MVLIPGPFSSVPMSLSNEIPPDVMWNGKARGGVIGDFATLMILSPAKRETNHINEHSC